MPAPQGQFANRIGLGVGIDDAGGAALAYLHQVRDALREIKLLGQQTGATKLPNLGERQPRAKQAIVEAAREEVAVVKKAAEDKVQVVREGARKSLAIVKTEGRAEIAAVVEKETTITRFIQTELAKRLALISRAYHRQNIPISNAPVFRDAGQGQDPAAYLAKINAATAAYHAAQAKLPKSLRDTSLPLLGQDISRFEQEALRFTRSHRPDATGKTRLYHDPILEQASLPFGLPPTSYRRAGADTRTQGSLQTARQPILAIAQMKRVQDAERRAVAEEDQALRFHNIAMETGRRRIDQVARVRATPREADGSRLYDENGMIIEPRRRFGPEFWRERQKRLSPEQTRLEQLTLQRFAPPPPPPPPPPRPPEQLGLPLTGPTPPIGISPEGEAYRAKVRAAGVESARLAATREAIGRERLPTTEVGRAAQEAAEIEAGANKKIAARKRKNLIDARINEKDVEAQRTQREALKTEAQKTAAVRKEVEAPGRLQPPELSETQKAREAALDAKIAGYKAEDKAKRAAELALPVRGAAGAPVKGTPAEQLAAIRAQAEAERQAGIVKQQAVTAASRAAAKQAAIEAAPVNVAGVTKSLDTIQGQADKTQLALNRVRFGKGADAIKAEARAITQEVKAVTIRAEALRAELGRPANTRRPTKEILHDLNSIEREMGQVQRKARQLNTTLLQADAPPGGGPGGGGRRAGPFGTTDILARITRNILLYQAVSTLTYGTLAFAAASIEAARASDDVSRALTAESIAAQTSSDANFKVAESLRLRLGTSRQIAQQTQTEALRFAQDQPYRAAGLAEAFADIAASRGMKTSEVPSLIEQVRRREPKFTKRIFGKTTEELYEAEAEKQIALRPPAGPRNYEEKFETQYDLVKKYVAEMTEAQKADVLLTASEQKGLVVKGAASARVEDLAGKMDRLSGRFLDAKESVGLFFLQLKPVNMLIEGLANTLQTIDLSKFTGTGPRGTIQEIDRDAYLEKSVNSTQAHLERVRGALGEFIITGGSFRAAYLQVYQNLGDQISDANDQFQQTKNQQILQQVREGIYRFRKPGEAHGITGEERKQLQIEGKSYQAGLYTEGYLETEAQSLARQKAEYATELEDEGKGIKAAERNQRAHEAEAKRKAEAQDILNRQAAGLAKLREAEKSIFQVGLQVAQVLAPENPFVQLFADGASAAQRMAQQWGHLSDAQIAYFTNLEHQRLILGLFKADLDSLAKSQAIYGKLNREAFVRETSPELDKRQQARVAIAEAGASAAQANIDLEDKRARVLGVGRARSPAEALLAKLAGVDAATGGGLTRAGFGAGFGEIESALQRADQFDIDWATRADMTGTSAKGRAAVEAIRNRETLALLADVDPEVIRNTPALRERYNAAVEGTIEANRKKVDDEISRAKIIEFDQNALLANVKAQDELRERRQAQIAGRAEYEQRPITKEEQRLADQIGEAADKQLITLTEGQDLDDETFKKRNEALRREAEREVGRKDAAQAAIGEGLDIQKAILTEIADLRKGIIEGDMALLVRVENDTQARIDKEKLKPISQGLEPRGGFPVRSSQPPPPQPKKRD